MSLLDYWRYAVVAVTIAVPVWNAGHYIGFYDGVNSTNQKAIFDQLKGQDDVRKFFNKSTKKASSLDHSGRVNRLRDLGILRE